MGGVSSFWTERDEVGGVEEEQEAYCQCVDLVSL
jgi:hypothetical protein